MDEPIFCGANGDEVGIKKYHIFFVGDQEEDDESPTPIQTSWVMQEYHIYNYLLNTHDHTHPSQNNNNNLSQTKSVSETTQESYIFTIFPCFSFFVFFHFTLFHFVIDSITMFSPQNQTK